MVAARDEPSLFSDSSNEWSVHTGLFYIDFELKSRLFQRLAGVVFNEAVRRMVSSFEARAKQLYTPVSASGAQSPLPGTASGD